MIFTYSLVSGLRAIQGSMSIQIALLFALLIFVKPPEEPFKDMKLEHS